MLRINLLHDAQPVSAVEEPASSLVAWVVGALAIALCACIAAAGFFLQSAQLERLEAQREALLLAPQRENEARENEALENETREAVQPAQATADDILRQAELLQRQRHARETAPKAVAALLAPLRLNDARERTWAIRTIHFDGQDFLIRGSAQDPDDIAELLETLGQEDTLAETRFTELRTRVDEDEQRRAGRRERVKVPVDFTLHATLAAHATGGE